MQNPANVIDGIRGSLNTIRVTLQNIAAERDQYQNLLHDSIQRVDNLRNQYTDSRNQNLRLQRLLDESRVQAERTVRERDTVIRQRDNAQGERDLAMLAYNNERQESHRWMFSYRDKDRCVQGLLREKFTKLLLYQRDTNRLQQNIRQLQTNAQNQLVIRQRDQNILNLQQQILALQNNPPQNMAAVHEIYQMLAPALGQVPNYIVLANDPYTGGNPAINSPATFMVWLQHKYREVMAGNAELALQSLIQERFNQGESPDIYESRVRKHIVGFADDQILPALYTHLPPDLRNSVKIYMTIRGAGNQTVDNFFADLRKCWVERQVGPNMFSQNQIQPQVSYQGATSADFGKFNTKIASLEAQLAEAMQVLSKLSERLQLPENVINLNNAPIYGKYINEELEKRLGVIEINLAKLTNLIREDTIDTKSARYRYSESSNYNNGGLEKRIEQIEAHLAKFARKDTKGAKTSQRQRSESSPFGGLEKRLDQIESLIAKLIKESKSRSGRIHMATVDEQSNPIFSDDDASKPEDNDDSDNSSTESDSGKRDMNVYITHGKKK
ncbi:unnamed protein product [Rhizophagus irregularis]|nr:unnamed protein product [Rhizophagus irregularis]